MLGLLTSVTQIYMLQQFDEITEALVFMPDSCMCPSVHPLSLGTPFLLRYLYISVKRIKN